jgi:RHS repeat-associated protein
MGTSMLAGSAVGSGRSGPSYGIYAFTGREWDPEIGLYYYRARYYDPKIGRFISEDPLRWFSGVNYFTYVDGNPVLYDDPLKFLEPCGKSYFIFGKQTPQDYRDMVEGIKLGLIDRYKNELAEGTKTSEQIDEAARELTYEMSGKEAMSIRDLKKQGRVDEITKTLQQIWDKIERRPKNEQEKKNQDRREKEKRCQ